MKDVLSTCLGSSGAGDCAMAERILAPRPAPLLGLSDYRRALLASSLSILLLLCMRELQELTGVVMHVVLVRLLAAGARCSPAACLC